MINGKCQIKFKPDSGSEITLLGLNHYKTLCKKGNLSLPLRSSDRKIYAVNKTAVMNIHGCFTATLASPTNKVQADIYVLKEDMPEAPLLSEDMLLKLGFMAYSATGAFARSVKTYRADRQSENSALDTEDDISDEEFQRRLDALHEKYAHVFKGIGLYKHGAVDLKLKPDATPFIARPIPCPLHLRPKASERFDQMKEEGIVKKVHSNEVVKFCSSMLIVPKPNKPNEPRIVVSFKELNARLEPLAKTPTPRVEDFLQVIRTFKYFFKVDLRHAFWQIPLTERASRLCCVSTFEGVYRFLRLVMGLMNASDHFDDCIRRTLAHLKDCISSRDDILGGGTTRLRMLQEYERVLEALSNAGLTLDPTKRHIGIDGDFILWTSFQQERDAARPRESCCTQDSSNSNQC